MHKVKIFTSIRDAKELFSAIKPANTKLSFFMSYDWFVLFETHITSQKNSQIYLLCLFEDNVPVAVLPLFTYISDSKIKILSSLSNYYTPIFDLLYNEVLISRKEALSLIFIYQKHFFKKFDQIDIYPLNQVDGWEYESLFKSLFFRPVVYHKTINWTNDFTDFSSLFKSFSPKLKNTIKRKTKKLLAEKDVEFTVTKCKEQALKKLQKYEEIYEKSWKVSEPYPNFIRQLVATSAERGELRLGALSVNDEDVAAQIWFVVGDEAYIYKLAYKPEYRRYSVGTILTYKMFEYCSTEDLVTKIDFLTGDDKFKQDWMTKQHELIGIQWTNMLSFKGFILGIINELMKIKKATMTLFTKL
jgi:hypothetical protein